MKKGFVYLLSLIIVIGFVTITSAQPVVTIVKDITETVAGLTDHVTGQITVTCDVTVTVVDQFPDELTLITVSVNGTEVDFSENTIIVEVAPTGAVISFEAQVTSVEAAQYTVCNTASAILDGIVIASHEDCLELMPYECFSKINLSEGQEVPVNTDVWFYLLLGVENCLDIVMEDVVITDNLGGDLEVNEWILYCGDAETRLTGKTEKAHLRWTIGTMSQGDLCVSDLIISTDINPAGQQEYTDEEPTVHDLNSGATLKFIASDTGFQCSAHTPPIMVTTSIP